MGKCMYACTFMFFLCDLSDEDDTVATLDCPPSSRSRQSLADQGDEVMPLWDSSRQSQNPRNKAKFSQQTSDADSAIGMVCVFVCVHTCGHECLLLNVLYSLYSLLKKNTSFCLKFSDAEALLWLITLVQPTTLSPLNLLLKQAWKVRGKINALVPVNVLKS